MDQTLRIWELKNEIHRWAIAASLTSFGEEDSRFHSNVVFNKQEDEAKGQNEVDESLWNGLIMSFNVCTWCVCVWTVWMLYWLNYKLIHAFTFSVSFHLWHGEGEEGLEVNWEYAAEETSIFGMQLMVFLRILQSIRIMLWSRNVQKEKVVFMTNFNCVCLIYYLKRHTDDCTKFQDFHKMYVWTRSLMFLCHSGDFVVLSPEY